jgi:hypothetical protein
LDKIVDRVLDGEQAENQFELGDSDDDDNHDKTV